MTRYTRTAIAVWLIISTVAVLAFGASVATARRDAPAAYREALA